MDSTKCDVTASSSNIQVTVSDLSHDPTLFWEKTRPLSTVMRFKTKIPKEPPAEGKARVVCLSDTHSMTSHMAKGVPDGDILIHAGDFTRSGHLNEVRQFNEWIGKLEHRVKIVVAGNHELTFDPNFLGRNLLIDPVHSTHKSSHTGNTLGFVANSPNKIFGSGDTEEHGQTEQVDPETIKKELTNCIYLEDSSTSAFGLKIYGSPWQPEFCNWAFNLKRGQRLLDKWDLIPDDTDILITHSPPVGYGDLCSIGVRAGCVDLLTTVQKRVRPKYHVYGHIHEGYGVRSDGKTVFVNASICDLAYNPVNRPIVFDIPLPKGHSKD